MSGHTNFNASRFTSGSNALVGTLAGAVALGVVRTVEASRRHAANAVTLGEWTATVQYLQARLRHCMDHVVNLTQQNEILRQENLTLTAELELARYHLLRARGGAPH